MALFWIIATLFWIWFCWMLINDDIKKGIDWQEALGFKTWKDWHKTTVAYIVIYILAGIFSFFIAFIFYCFYPIHETYHKDHTDEIVALQDNTVFVVYRYSSDSQGQYHYMRRNGDGGFSPITISQAGSTIYEADGPPHVDVYLKMPAHTASFWNKQYFSIIKILGVSSYPAQFKIYTPKGTIKQDFTIDLKQ